MVDYAYYVGDYMGSVIPENAFPTAAARAQHILAQLCRRCHVVGGEDSRAMAVCAMAETLYAAPRHSRGVAEERVGEVSVRYDSSRAADRALWRELYRKAAIYLDFYRGVQ